jgi:hypothetical protein
MQYQAGFMVTYTRADGKTLKAYVPPCWMLTGAERRLREVQDKAKWRKGRLARYWEALQQKRMM